MKAPKSWLLLLYGLPTHQSASRVSLWRKLKKFGAIQLKTSAYVLPDTPLHFERFQWLAKQVRDSGGDATLIRVTEVDGLSSEEIAHLFNKTRSADYAALGKEISVFLARKRKPMNEADALETFRQQFNQIREIDYFDCAAAHDAEMMLKRLESSLNPKARHAAKLDARKFLGKTWVTRPRPEIDRVCSAWLIRRFIDPKAKFVFARTPQLAPGAIPYDMVDVEFTHHGEDCTFETLTHRFSILDKAIQQIAEAVHDADLEDGKFQRTEAVGLDRIFKGWARRGLSDEQILAKGFECLDALYAALK